MMTKREFDALTKENWGGKGMARDERCNYRERRMLKHNGSGAHEPTDTAVDYLAEREHEIRYLRRIRDWHEPLLPVLGIGSRWRAPAAWRAKKGQTLLTGRI